MEIAVKKTIRDVAILLATGILYYLFNRLTGLGIPCVFRKLTGLPCPSCGISHMFIDLFALDFKSAFFDNHFLFLTWPLAAIEIIYLIYHLESGKNISKLNIFLIGSYAAALTVYGILRIYFGWYHL